MGKKPTVKVVEVRTTQRHIPLKQKTCPVCGKSFMGATPTRYCSKSCLNKAAYQRNAEAYRQARKGRYRQHKERAAKSGSPPE